MLRDCTEESYMGVIERERRLAVICKWTLLIYVQAVTAYKSRRKLCVVPYISDGCPASIISQPKNELRNHTNPSVRLSASLATALVD